MVTFTGYVPADEVRPWLQAAGAVVLPYRKIEQSGAPVSPRPRTSYLAVRRRRTARICRLRRMGLSSGAPDGLADVISRFLTAPTADDLPAPHGADVTEIAQRTVAAYGVNAGSGEAEVRY